MTDDEINQMLQAMKDAGLPEEHAKKTLELLAEAEALSEQIAADALPSQRQAISETIEKAVRQIFKGDA